MCTLRTRVIRLAASMPCGSRERQDILKTLVTGKRHASNSVMRVLSPILDNIQRDLRDPGSVRFHAEKKAGPDREVLDVVVADISGKEVVFYPTEKPGEIATNMGKRVYDKAGIQYRWMIPLKSSEVETLLRTLISILLGTRAFESERAPEDVGIWSVASIGQDGYVTECEEFGSKKEAEATARSWGGAYVVKGTQMWNEPLGQVEEHYRVAPYKFVR